MKKILYYLKKYTIGLDYQKPRYIKCKNWNIDKIYYVRAN